MPPTAINLPVVRSSNLWERWVAPLMVFGLTGLLWYPNTHHYSSLSENAQIMLRDQRVYVASWMPPTEAEIMERQIPVCLNITTERQHHKHDHSHTNSNRDHHKQKTNVPAKQQQQYSQHVCLRRHWDYNESIREGPVYFYEPNWDYAEERDVLAVHCSSSEDCRRHTMLSYEYPPHRRAKGAVAQWRLQTLADHGTTTTTTELQATVNISKAEELRTDGKLLRYSVNATTTLDSIRVQNLISQNGIEWESSDNVVVTVQECDDTVNEPTMIPDICFVDAQIRLRTSDDDNADDDNATAQALASAAAMVLVVGAVAVVFLVAVSSVVVGTKLCWQRLPQSIIEPSKETEFTPCCSCSPEDQVEEELAATSSEETEDDTLLFTRPSQSWRRKTRRVFYT